MSDNPIHFKAWPACDTEGPYIGLHVSEHNGRTQDFYRLPLTPDKARRMATALLQAADTAEAP